MLKEADEPLNPPKLLYLSETIARAGQESWHCHPGWPSHRSSSAASTEPWKLVSGFFPAFPSWHRAMGHGMLGNLLFLHAVVCSVG